MTDVPTRNRSARLRPFDVAILTIGMGIAVTISWVIFFRRVDSYSLDLDSMIRPGRLLVYATQFLLVGGFAYALARGRLRRLAAPTLAAGVTSGWLMQGVVLTVIGAPLVANELDPEIAWYCWLVATAGPLQPAVAFVGGWFGLRS